MEPEPKFIITAPQAPAPQLSKILQTKLNICRKSFFTISFKMGILHLTYFVDLHTESCAGLYGVSRGAFPSEDLTGGERPPNHYERGRGGGPPLLPPTPAGIYHMGTLSRASKAGGQESSSAPLLTALTTILTKLLISETTFTWKYFS